MKNIIWTEDHEKKQHVAEDDNLDLVGQIIQQNTLDVTILNSKAVYKRPVYVQQNLPEWLEIMQKKLTRSCFPALLVFYGKAKFEMTLNIVKNRTAEPEMKHIKNISRGHQFEDDAIAQFECITKCKTATRCGYFEFANNMRYGSSPDALGSLGILFEAKTRAEGSLSPLEYLEKVSMVFYAMSVVNALH